MCDIYLMDDCTTRVVPRDVLKPPPPALYKRAIISYIVYTIYVRFKKVAKSCSTDLTIDAILRRILKLRKEGKILE